MFAELAAPPRSHDWHETWQNAAHKAAAASKPAAAGSNHGAPRLAANVLAAMKVSGITVTPSRPSDQSPRAPGETAVALACAKGPRDAGLLWHEVRPSDGKVGVEWFRAAIELGRRAMRSLATRGNRAHAAHALPCVLRSAEIIGSFSRLRSMMRENNRVEAGSPTVVNMMNRWIHRARDKVSKRRIAERRNAERHEEPAKGAKRLGEVFGGFALPHRQSNSGP